jgi:hypothetical protein
MTMPEVIRIVENKIQYRMPTFPIGVWTMPMAPIDAALDHILREFGLPCTARNRSKTFGELGFPSASICRIRKPSPVFTLPESWLLRMQDYSGIPATELRKVACLDFEIAPHPKARRA